MRKKAGRVLCISSSPIEQNLRCGTLKDHGWDVVSAGTGFEGVFQFGKEAVDAVILDLGGDGSEAALIASELKRQRPEVPVIVLTEAEKTLANGATDLADAVIPKSEEPESLMFALRQIMERH